MLTRFLALGLTVAAMMTLAGCSTNAATGRQQILSLSSQDEIKLGTEAKPELVQEYGGAVPDPQLQRYVSDLGKKLAAMTEADNPGLPWEFTFLNSGVVNAFALPGGKVFITRGLAQEMTNEAQMAAVIGHEIGHVTAKHTNERFSQQTITTVGGAIIGGLLGAAAGGSDGVGAGVAGGATVGQVAALSFSRDQEIEADRLGARYMEKLNYNPQGAVQVQEILARVSGGGDGGFDIMATHPSSQSRIDALNARIKKYYQHTVNNPQYDLFEDRFKTRFLTRLKALPPAPAPKKTDAGDQGHGRGSMLLAALGDPATWCGHCRAAALAEAK